MNNTQRAPYALSPWQLARKHGYTGNEAEFVRQMLYGAFPPPPETDGRYRLDVIVAGGKPTYFWTKISD